MLIREDMHEKPKDIIEYENEVIKELRQENEKLRQLVFLNQEKIIAKIEFLFQTYLLRETKQTSFGDNELETRILELLNVFDRTGSAKQFSLPEIASTLNIPETNAIKTLDTLMEQKKVSMGQNMKYRRLDLD